MNITKQYVHPQEQTVLDAIEKCEMHRVSTNSGTVRNLLGRTRGGIVRNQLIKKMLSGAPGQIRTADLLVRSQTLYPAELRARERRDTASS
jgi:predicted ATP-dependent serine protease